MAIATYTTQLEEVQAAITAVLSGQSYTITGGDGMTISVGKSDLGTLTERERWLRKMVARETRSGVRVFGGTPV